MLEIRRHIVAATPCQERSFLGNSTSCMSPDHLLPQSLSSTSMPGSSTRLILSFLLGVISTMFAVRSGAFNGALTANLMRGASTRAFHASRPALVKVGDAVPGKLPVPSMPQSNLIHLLSPSHNPAMAAHQSSASSNSPGVPRDRLQLTATDIPLMESSPGSKVSLKQELSPPAHGIIIGVPAAFSPSCSAKHIPGYLNSDKLKNAGKVFVVSVNDAFV